MHIILPRPAATSPKLVARRKERQPVDEQTRDHAKTTLLMIQVSLWSLTGSSRVAQYRAPCMIRHSPFGMPTCISRPPCSLANPVFPSTAHDSLSLLFFCNPTPISALARPLPSLLSRPPFLETGHGEFSPAAASITNAIQTQLHVFKHCNMLHLLCQQDLHVGESPPRPALLPSPAMLSFSHLSFPLHNFSH